MVTGVVPRHALYAHGGVRGVEGLKLAILIACLEDEAAVVFPLQAVVLHILGCGVADSVCPTAVLQHHGLYFLLLVAHGDGAITQLHAHLLVRSVNVDVGVCGHAESHSRLLFHNHEARLEDGVLRVVVIDRQPIVAAYGRHTSVVRDLQAIVGILNRGVYRLFHVVDGVAVGKALAIVACEELVAHRPVGLAMFQLVGVAVIFVCEVVEGNVHDAAAAQLHYWHLQPLVIGRDL